MRRAAAVVLAAVVLPALAAWVWLAASPPPPGEKDRRGPVTKAVAAARQSVADAAAGGARTVTRWLGVAPGDRPAAVPAADVLDVRPAPPASPARRAGAKPKGAEPAIAADVAAAPVPGAVAGVYSAADTDVIPPQLTRSRLPSAPRPGVRPEDLPEVEVVVSPAGDVESVRLMTQEAGVLPAMMLSAIKSWHFTPATKDGHPVRYRLRMRLTNR